MLCLISAHTLGILCMGCAVQVVLGREPEYTFASASKQVGIDYVWYSRDTILPRGVLSTPTRDFLEEFGALPNGLISRYVVLSAPQGQVSFFYSVPNQNAWFCISFCSVTMCPWCRIWC